MEMPSYPLEHFPNSVANCYNNFSSEPILAICSVGQGLTIGFSTSLKYMNWQGVQLFLPHSSAASASLCTCSFFEQIGCKNPGAIKEDSFTASLFVPQPVLKKPGFRRRQRWPWWWLVHATPVVMLLWEKKLMEHFYAAWGASMAQVRLSFPLDHLSTVEEILFWN